MVSIFTAGIAPALVSRTVERMRITPTAGGGYDFPPRGPRFL